jgi:hypothetical protein
MSSSPIHTDSNNNLAFGSFNGLDALGSLTTGQDNVAIIGRAGTNVTSAVGHVLIGVDTGMFITTGAGSSSTSSQPNVCIGYTAGKYAGAAAQNGGTVAVGPGAGGGSTLYSTAAAYYSITAVGELALANVGGSQKDVAVGSVALFQYLRGGQNTAIGRGAAQNLIEGSYNFFASHAAAGQQVYSTESIIIGDSALNIWDSAAPIASFTGSIRGKILTVSAVTSGVILPETTLVSGSSAGLDNYAQIAPYGTNGTTGSGGAGTYTLTLDLGTVASQALWTGPGGTNIVAIGQLSGPTGYNDSYCVAIGNGASTGAGSHRTAIGNGQTAAYISGNLGWTSNPAPITGAAGQTWSARQLTGHLIFRSGAAHVSDTTPTAAAIVAAIPGCEVGSTVWFDVVNNNRGTLSIVAGAGVTLEGKTTISAGFTRRYAARVTNATAGKQAVTLYGIFTAAS